MDSRRAASEPDLENHDHDQDFYELFHDSADEFMGLFVSGCFMELPRILGEHNKKLTGKMLDQQDMQALGCRGTEEMDRIAAAIGSKQAGREKNYE